MPAKAVGLTHVLCGTAYDHAAGSFPDGTPKTFCASSGRLCLFNSDIYSLCISAIDVLEASKAEARLTPFSG